MSYTKVHVPESDDAPEHNECALLDDAPGWTPSAARDMQTLAKHPGIKAIDLDPGRAVPSHGDESDARDRANERSRAEAVYAARRLARMAACGHPEGKRLADVLWTAYGERGDTLNKRESVALAIGVKYATADELTACAATIRGVSRKTAEGMAPIAIGSKLVAWAIEAYERDVWTAVEAAKPRRLTFAERVVMSYRKAMGDT